MNEYTVDLIDKSKLFYVLSQDLCGTRESMEGWRSLPIGARVLMIAHHVGSRGMLTTVVQTGRNFSCRNPSYEGLLGHSYMFRVEPVRMEGVTVGVLARTRRLPEEVETHLNEYSSNLIVPRRLIDRNPLAAIAQWYTPVVKLLGISGLSVAIYVRRSDTGELLLPGGNFAGVTSLRVELRTVRSFVGLKYSDVDGRVPEPSMVFSNFYDLDSRYTYYPIGFKTIKMMTQLPYIAFDPESSSMIPHIAVRHAPLRDVWISHPIVSDNDNVLIEAIAQIPSSIVLNVIKNARISDQTALEIWRWMQQATSLLTDSLEDSVLIVLPFGIRRYDTVYQRGGREPPESHGVVRVRSDVTGAELKLLSQVPQDTIQLSYISSSSFQLREATIPGDRSLCDVIDVQDVLVHTPIYVRTERRTDEQMSLRWALIDGVPSARRRRGEGQEAVNTVSIRMPGTGVVQSFNTTATVRALGLAAPVTFVSETDRRRVTLNQFDPIGTLTPTTSVWSVVESRVDASAPDLRGGHCRTLGAHYRSR